METFVAERQPEIAPERIAWNKGKLVGAKPAPRLGNVSTRVAHLAAYRD